MFQTLYKPFEAIPVVKSVQSDTVPDMSFTPREILSKFSRGEKVPLGFRGLYDSEDDPDDLFSDDPSIFEDDPTRELDFDFGDYVEESNALHEREKERSRRSQAKKSRQSKRKASDEEVSLSDPTKRETTSGDGETPSSSKPKSD